MKLGIKRTIDWNKYQSKSKIQKKKQNLDYQTDPNFRGVNRLFISSFTYNAFRISYKQYFLLIVERKITRLWLTKNCFDHAVKYDLGTYDNIWKITTGQGDDYTTGYLLDYVYFRNYYNTDLRLNRFK